MPDGSAQTTEDHSQKVQDKNQQEGLVTEALPNTTFRVQLGDGRKILAHLSGKMRIHFIRILAGDRVLVEVDSGGERGRIVYRYK